MTDATPYIRQSLINVANGVAGLDGGGKLSAPLPNVGPGVTTMGDATHSAVITIDAEGRVTGLTEDVITGGGGGGGGVITTGSDVAGSVTGWSIAPSAGSVQLSSPIWTNLLAFLPAAASYGQNLLYVKNNIQPPYNYTLIIDLSGSDTMDGGQVSTLTLQRNDTLTVWSDGVSDWKIIGIQREADVATGNFQVFAGPDEAFWGTGFGDTWTNFPTRYNTYSSGGFQYLGESYYDRVSGQDLTPISIYGGVIVAPYFTFAAASYAVICFPEIVVPNFDTTNGQYIEVDVLLNCIGGSGTNGVQWSGTHTFTSGNVDYQFDSTDMGSTLFQYGSDLSIVAGSGNMNVGLVSAGGEAFYWCSVQYSISPIGGSFNDFYFVFE